MKVISSFSGGKDSCFALYKAQEMDHQISFIANTISNDHQRVRFHGLTADIIQKQAESLGIPLLQAKTAANNYRTDYIKNLKRGLKSNVQGLVLGDIHLQDCYKWAEDVCQELDLQLIEPLWKIPTEKIFKDFINAGFEAVVVSTQEKLLDESWVGRKLDKQFLRDIKKLKNIDICGENGEYHTLVLNGPNFKNGLKIKKSEKKLIDGYWFLDIQVLN